MEHPHRAPVATFFSPERPVAGQELALGEDAAHHARVRRLDVGSPIRVVDGEGRAGSATLLRLAKRHVALMVHGVELREAPPPAHVLLPVADRERMLWTAEKCAELGAASWRPVLWRRSRSVTPRGEGPTFTGKARARMIGALEQSGGAWLPALYPEATVERALAAAPAGTRLLLDVSGTPILRASIIAPVTIAVGPEGGIEADEREQFLAAGWTPVSLAGNVLRFETATLAGLAIARAALGSNSDGGTHG